MKEKSIAFDKSYEFALAIINVCREVQLEEKEYILTKQLIRSGTSIGANLQEAICGQSEKDFLYKVNIAYKEARESRYWISLLRDSSFISMDESITLINALEEILKILGATIKTMRKKLA